MHKKKKTIPGEKKGEDEKIARNVQKIPKHKKKSMCGADGFGAVCCAEAFNASRHSVVHQLNVEWQAI